MSEGKIKTNNQNTSGNGKLGKAVKVVTAVVTVGAAVVKAIEGFSSKKS